MSVGIVQASTPREAATGLSATTAFSSNPTAGNAIVTFCTHNDEGSAGGAVTFSDGVNTYTNDYSNQHQSNLYSIYFASSFVIAAHGSPLTVTATYSAGTSGNQRWLLSAYEVSGLGAFDQGAQNIGNPTTTPTTGATGTLANANSLLLAAVCANQSLAGATVPPTGGPGTFTDIIHDLTGASSVYGDLAYQVQTSGTSAVNASWGTITTGCEWIAAVAVYKASVTTGGRLLLMNNQGGF